MYLESYFINYQVTRNGKPSFRLRRTTRRATTSCGFNAGRTVIRADYINKLCVSRVSTHGPYKSEAEAVDKAKEVRKDEENFEGWEGQRVVHNLKAEMPSMLKPISP